MVHYRISYFDVRGYGEIVRLMLQYANQKYEDVRISHEEWPKFKPTTPFGKVPVLEVDGKPLAESYAITRYLAREYGLAGKDSWEQAKVDEIAEFHKDFVNEVAPFVRAYFEFVPGNKEQLRNEVFVPAVAKTFPVYVRVLKESGSGFFVKSGLTWIDFMVSEYFTTLKNIDTGLFNMYPQLMEYRKRVQTHPKVRDYISKRKESVV